MKQSTSCQKICYTWFFTSRGESYLNPEFLEMVKVCIEEKNLTALIDQRHYLNDQNARKTVESGLDRLIISIDGATQEVYQQYRVGGRLDKVLEGARNIVKWKKALKSKTPYIFFQFLVVKPNEHQLEDIKLMARETGVDGVRFKTAQVYDFQNDPNHLIPTRKNTAATKKMARGISKLRMHCITTAGGYGMPR